VAFPCSVEAVEAEDNLGGGAFPRKCNCWPCENCAPGKKWHLIQDIANGEPDRFITITCREGQFATPEEAAREQRYAFKKAVQNWRRLDPNNKCEYGVVREAHENGQPHMHVAWRGGWIDQAWLSNEMGRFINSPIVWVEKITNKRNAAYYISKYLGKGPHQFGTLKRYWFSKGYRRKHKAKPEPIFRKELRFRPRGRTMYQVRDELDRLNVDYTVLYGKMIIWHTTWVPPPKREKIEPKRLLYHNGFLRYHTSKGWGLPPDGT